MSDEEIGLWTSRQGAGQSSSLSVGVASSIIRRLLIATLHVVGLDSEWARTQANLAEYFRNRLRRFHQAIREGSVCDYRKVEKGDLPSLEHYNDTFADFYEDLLILFGELGDLNRILKDDFNSILRDKNYLLHKIGTIRSKLGDYYLYTRDPEGINSFFKDDFRSLEYIDTDAPLSYYRCKLDPEAGIVTLPAALPASIGVTTSIGSGSMDAASWSMAGSTLPQNVASPYDVYDYTIDIITDPEFAEKEMQGGPTGQGNRQAAISDGMPHTWYAQTWGPYSQADLPSTSPTMFLRLTLGAPGVVNFISIDAKSVPGQHEPFKIKKLETSLDGRTYLSVRDEVPVADFLGEDLEEKFSFSNDEASFYFTPRKVKYIKMELDAGAAYENLSQDRQQSFDTWWYSIGISEISVVGIRYQTRGEIRSISFGPSAEEIKKVALLASENPVEASNLADIRHYIAPNDSDSWMQIQPMGRSGRQRFATEEAPSGALVTSDVPEIVNFNTKSAIGTYARNTMITDSPVTTLRHRMVMERYPNAFNDAANAVPLVTKQAGEFFSIPTRSPYRFTLSATPLVDYYLYVVNPFFGSRGKKNPKFYLGNGVRDQNRLLVPLPLAFDITKVERGDMHIWIDDREWTYKDPGTAFTSAAAEEYTIVSQPGALRPLHYVLFGDGAGGDSQKGKVPGVDSVIAMTLGEEQLVLVANQAWLDFYSDGSKENTSIYRWLENQTATGQLRPNGIPHIIGGTTTYSQSIAVHCDIKKPFYELAASSVTVTEIDSDGDQVTDGAFQAGQEKDFQDGNAELDTDGDYSIDPDRGIIYSKQPATWQNVDGLLHTDNTITITFNYDSKALIPVEHWDFVPGRLDRLQFADEALLTAEQTKSIVSADHGKSFLDLGSTYIAVGSIRMPWDPNAAIGANDTPAGIFGQYEPREVEFIDGITEFLNYRGIRAASITTAAEESANLWYFDLAYGSSIVRLNPVFSDSSVFDTQVYAEPENPGEYRVLFTGDSLPLIKGRVYFYSSTYTDGDDIGTVTYFVEDTQATTRHRGEYSVDYKLGYLHTNPGTPIDKTDTYGIDAMSSDAVSTIIFSTVKLTTEYNIADPISDSKRVIDYSTASVLVDDSEVQKARSSLIGSEAVSTREPLFKIIYTYAVENRESLFELEKYFSPISRSYALKVFTTSSL